MAAPRVIPGYYFDPERKKYFKITTSGNTTPGTAEARYGQENIRKEKIKAEAQQQAKRKWAQVEKETIVRPHTRKMWGAQLASLEREIGARRKSMYLHGLWPDACVGRMGKMKFALEAPWGSPVVRFFDRDPHTKTIYAVHGDNAIRRRRRHSPDGVPSTTEALNEYSFEFWDTLAHLTSSISSLVYLPASGTLAATTLGYDRPPMVYLSQPDVNGPYAHQKVSHGDYSAIWGAAASPYACNSNSIPQADTECLALATCSALELVIRSPDGKWDSSATIETDADVLSVDWLSPTLVVFGKRDGRIHLYDTRSRDSSHILSHPFPVTKLKRADDPTRFVCAGAPDSLFLYDIRSRNKFSPSEPGHYNSQFFATQHWGAKNLKMRKTMQLNSGSNWSQPILSFPYNNVDDQNLDIAVQPELGVIAAPQNVNASAALKIFNLWTGKLLKKFPQAQQERVKANIRCLRFMQDENGDQELWSTWGASIVKMSMV